MIMPLLALTVNSVLKIYFLRPVRYLYCRISRQEIHVTIYFSMGSAFFKKKYYLHCLPKLQYLWWILGASGAFFILFLTLFGVTNPNVALMWHDLSTSSTTSKERNNAERERNVPNSLPHRSSTDCQAASSHRTEPEQPEKSSINKDRRSGQSPFSSANKRS